MSDMDNALERAQGFLPAEDLKFASQSDEQIRSLAQQPSFERTAMMKRLRVKNRSQQVLVAHLYLDHVLAALLVEQMARPAALDLERTTFSQKLQMTLAIGIMDEAEASALKAVNALRNRLAHTLSFTVSERDVARLRAATPKIINDWALEQSKRLPRRITLYALLTGIVWIAEVRRQQALERKLMEQRNRIRLAAAMLEAERVLRRQTSVRAEM